MKSKQTAIAGVSLLALGPLPAAVLAQNEYQAVIIEPWNQTYHLATSSASGINNDNVVSGCATPISGSCSFLWTLEGGKVAVNLTARSTTRAGSQAAAGCGGRTAC